MAAENAAMPGPTRKFGPISLGFFAIILLGVWTFAAGTLGVGLYGGGVPVFVYGSVAIGAATSVMALVLAELSSAYPSRAGIVIAATKVAGPEWGHLCGYFTGGFLGISAVFTPSALVIVTAQLCADVGVAAAPSWEPKKWEMFLIYQFFNLAFLFCVIYAQRVMDWVSNIGSMFSLCPSVLVGNIADNLLIGVVLFLALFVTIGLLVGLTDSTNPSSFVWSTIVNGTGWNNSMCILVGLTGPAYAYGPTHWLMSMADDCHNPRRSIPIATGIQQVGNILSLFAFYVAAGYAVTDWDALLETNFPAPIGALFEQVTKSKGATIALLLVILIPGCIGNVSYISATLRMVHGYAESGALPKQKWLTKWDRRGETPISILYVETAVTFVMGCVYLGSDVGFTVILSSCYVFGQMGYIALLLGYVCTRGAHLSPDRWLRLPRWLGMGAAVFSLLYQVFLLVLYILPPVYPVTAENMNWGVVFAVGGGAFLTVTWRLRKDSFLGYPEETMVETASLGSNKLTEVAHEPAKLVEDRRVHGQDH